MVECLDSEFGPIGIYRRRGGRQISFKITPSGQLRVTAPAGTPNALLKIFLQSSHQQITEIVTKYRAQNCYLPGMLIGKTHLLKLEYDQRLSQPLVRIRPNFLVVRLPLTMQPTDEVVQSLLRTQVQKILKQDARQILPGRLQFLAERYRFRYRKLKLSHASTRWGSCSASGVISLNIGLVTLPNQLIDYVLIHELCHLRQMNHSPAFWAEVAAILPDYQQRQAELRRYSPYI